MSSEETVAKIASLIKDIEVAMLTTLRADGSLHSRPMITQRTDFDGVLWFFTQAEAPKVGEVEREEHVSVSYAAPSKQHYVAISGKARLVRDRDRVKELWHPLLKAWFPKGPDDPSTALLRVEADSAEYWDSSSSTVVHLVGLVKALATGKPYKPGDNEKIDLDKSR